MDTKTSTLSTNTNSPVTVGPGNSNYRMDRGRSTNWIFWASICGGVAALAFIYRLYQLLILVRQDNSAANSFLTIWLPSILIVLGVIGAIYFLTRQINAKTYREKAEGERETMRQRHEMEVESERARKIQEENERNQMAILRLLDELGDLAEGDLTVNATVSEDFTGAIADSVNFAIDQVRQLVSAINVTAERVARASDQTQATAVELAEASENQAQEIAGASAAINEMAVSIDQVSSNAAESAAVADRSVAIAYNGAEVVQRTIDGMNTIRDQIQETSKRIKRLGE